jgi:hypothetical protein
MFINSKVFLTAVVLWFTFLSACSSSDAQKNTNSPATGAPTNAAAPPSAGADPKPAATPRNDFKPADIAKLKWIVGTWRGMDGDKPFYERYTLEGATLIVQGLKEDGSNDGEASRFELKNGEFGKTEGDNRSAASEITDKYVQFVAVNPRAGGPRRNSFRFEDEGNGTWNAILEWPATADKPAQQKVYKMEPWK